MYKFLFDADGNFYGMAQVVLNENTLDQIRLDKDKRRLVPIRAPSFDGRPFEIGDQPANAP
jgi:hypothetical protein